MSRMRYTFGPTSHETFDDCHRKWFFEKIVRQTRPSKGYLTYGTVLHGVIERFLSADDTGRDARGQPVELYPDGWDEASETLWISPDEKITVKDRITPAQADTIKKLMVLAQEQGLLARWPGRMVEMPFGEVWNGQPAFELARDLQGRTMGLTGRLDLLLPHPEVRDWKSTKDMRYVPSVRKLANDPQSGLYAAVALQLYPNAQQVIVGRTYFSKDPEKPIIKHVSVPLSREEIAGHVARAKARAMVMLQLAQVNPENWYDVEGPAPGSNACGAFGGCAFAPICTHRMTLTQHRGVVLTHENQRAKMLSTKPPSRGAPEMGVLTDRTNAPAGAPANPPQMPAAMPAAMPPAMGPATPPIPEHKTAPWARPDDAACGGLGIVQAGQACRVCDELNQRGSLLTSAYFDLRTDGEGFIVFQAKQATQNVLAGMNIPLLGRVRIPVVASAPAPTAQVKAVNAPAAVVEGERTFAPPPPGAVPQGPPAAAAPAAAPAADSLVAAAYKMVGEKPPVAAAPAPVLPSTVLPSAPPTADPGSVSHVSPGVTAGHVTAPKKGRGRPPTGFLMFLNGQPERGFTPDQCIYLDKVLASYGHELAKAGGVKSYYDLPVFQRRDAVAAHAAEFAAEFGAGYVFASWGHDADIDSFVTALAPYSYRVVVFSPGSMANASTPTA